MKAFGNTAKAELYPKKPIVSSLESDDLAHQNLIEVEVFYSPPDKMPEATFDDVRIAINTSDTPLSLTVKMPREIWRNDLEPMGILILPAGMSSIWTWHNLADCLVLTIPQKTLDLTAQKHSIVEPGQGVFENFLHLNSQTVTMLSRELASICETFFDERSVSYEAISKALMVMLLRKASRIELGSKASVQGKEKTKSNTSNTLHNEIVTYLASNYQRRITTDELASHTGKTRSHFSRVFKAETGLPPHKFLVRYRVEKAVTLIHQGLSQLSDISSSCGFADQAHFSRCFKRETGYTPRSFIKNLTK